MFFHKCIGFLMNVTHENPWRTLVRWPPLCWGVLFFFFLCVFFYIFISWFGKFWICGVPEAQTNMREKKMFRTIASLRYRDITTVRSTANALHSIGIFPPTHLFHHKLFSLHRPSILFSKTTYRHNGTSCGSICTRLQAVPTTSTQICNVGSLRQ